MGDGGERGRGMPGEGAAWEQWNSGLSDPEPSGWAYNSPKLLKN